MAGGGSKMKVTYTFNDGDVVIASTQTVAIIWTRMYSQWYNHTLGGPCTANDQRIEEMLRSDDKDTRWTFVGNFFTGMPESDPELFTVSFYYGED